MREYTYQIGPRSELVGDPVKPANGTKFLVDGGPYWTTANGDRIKMRARGVMTFNYAFTRGGCTFLDATSDREGHVILHVSGDRPPSVAMPEMTMRPYRIVSRYGIRRRKGVRG